MDRDERRVIRSHIITAVAIVAALIVLWLTGVEARPDW